MEIYYRDEIGSTKFVFINDELKNIYNLEEPICVFKNDNITSILFSNYQLWIKE